MADAPTTPPADFNDLCDHIAHTVDKVDDDLLREDIFRSIEQLVIGVSGPWRGCRVAFTGRTPDNCEGLF
jgi:hypothetical protein